jgi:hypothetical protein
MISPRKMPGGYPSLALQVPGGGTFRPSPDLCLLPALHLHPSSLPQLPFGAWCLFSEPQNLFQACDIYSLELEFFLFLFLRVRPMGEISPEFVPALLEVKS